MNRKLIPAALFKSRLTTALSACSLVATLGVVACDGNDDNNRPDVARPDTTQPDTTGDTTQPDTTTPTDTTQPDTTPVDTVQPPDVVERQNTVKYARTLVAQEPCTADFRNDIDPQAQLDDVIVISPVYTVSQASGSNPARYGFYVADADGGAYSGILVVTSETKPELAPGNVVDVRGQLMEAFCNAQVSNATLTKKSEGTAPEPLIQNPIDLAQDAYEGMLIKVIDAEVEAIAGQGQARRIKGTSLSFGFIFETGFINLEIGSTYDVTGIIRSTRFGGVEGFQFVPRYPSDVVLKSATTTPITDIQGSTISTNCASTGRQVHGTHIIQGTLQTDRFSAASTLNGYYLTDGSSSPYSGILLVEFKNDQLPAYAKGDLVRVTGQHLEFFCLTEFQINSIEKIGDTGTLPMPAVIDKSITKADLEQWEGVLVEVQGVTAGGFVERNASGQNVFYVDTDTNFKVDSFLIGSAFQNGAAITNKTLTTLRGILRYSFDEYRISPRSADDWIIAE